MERGLSNRHVQFIAIGGTIGTGLFLGSGKSISLTGPSIIFVYILVGIIMFFLMRAIGEMMYRDPSQHTFINFITRYLGNGWGHFAGWTYWAALVLLGMTEITAVSTYFITFFDTFGIDLTHWKWLIELCFLVSLVSVNLIAVKVFGEVEFWFSMIKITLICAMIATAVVMIVIGYHYPAVQIHGVDHVSPAGHAGFDNLFANFSFAPNGWMAFLMSFQMVFFAYEMIEFVGVTVSRPEPAQGAAQGHQRDYRARAHLLRWRTDGHYVHCAVDLVQAEQGRFLCLPVHHGVPVRRAELGVRAGVLRGDYRRIFRAELAAVLGWPPPVPAGRGVAEPDAQQDRSGVRPQGAGSCDSGVRGADSAVADRQRHPRHLGAFVLFSSASSAVFLFIYILTLMAHRKYRRSADFIPDGFVMPAWKVLNTVAIAFFVFIYLTLFLADDTRNSAIAGLVWLVGFGGFSMLRERYRSRDLKVALEHKEI